MLIFVTSLLVAAASSSSCANLSEAGAMHGLQMGSALKSGHLYNQSDPSYKLIWTEQYRLATAEYECKWGPTEPENGQFNFDLCDKIVNYAPTTRGHNLCWGQGNPKWILDPTLTPQQLATYLIRHVSVVVDHYANQSDKVFCWDVVNEAVSDGPAGEPMLKNSTPWYPAVPDYIDIAFSAARKANPNVLLFYNDYGAEDLGPKSDRVFALVQGMKARAIPIDGVGLQFHLRVDMALNYSACSENIKRLGLLGLQVHITELDVFCPTPCDEQAEASVYLGVLGACVANPKVCTVFESWGFTDRYTWLYDVPWNPQRRDPHPLPFDENYAPKAAWNSMMNKLCP